MTQEVKLKPTAPQPTSLPPLLTQSELLTTLDRVKAEIESVPGDMSFDMKRVKAVDKMVKSAQDPARNKSSAL